MRLRIDLGYDGGGFHGWARQPGLRTVQGDLEAALDTVLRVQGSTLTVAGRTDTGVHARGQVAHVDVDGDSLSQATRRRREPVLAALARRLNGVLGPDVRVTRVVEAAAGFDARFSALWRRYAYRLVDDGGVVDPLARGHVATWGRTLDETLMAQASGLLLGEHDFAAYCRRREGATTVRTLLDIDWERRPDGVLVGTVRADAFCHSMVRSLVGALVAVGEGRQAVEWPTEVLTRGLRDGAVKVMPARGLVLEEVCYPADEELAAQARLARVVRVL